MIGAVIPVKRLAEGKSRLAGRLTSGERAALMAELVQRTVATLRAARVAGRIVLATPEEELASDLGVEWLPDGDGLNAALGGAVRWATEIGATRLLILPADLPLLTADDLRDFTCGAEETAGVCIAPTRDGGTGALLLSPPGVIPLTFGPSSFAGHLAAARQRGVGVRQVMRTGLAFELDTVDDLDALTAFGSHVQAL